MRTIMTVGAILISVWLYTAERREKRKERREKREEEKVGCPATHHVEALSLQVST